MALHTDQRQIISLESSESELKSQYLVHRSCYISKNEEDASQDDSICCLDEQTNESMNLQSTETTTSDNPSCQCRCCIQCQERYLNDNRIISHCQSSDSPTINHQATLNRNHHHRRRTYDSDQIIMNPQVDNKLKQADHLVSTKRHQIIRNRHNTRNLLSVIVINFLLSQLYQHYIIQNTNSFMPQMFVQAEESNGDYCNSIDDCKDGERICHENKCICPRERPVEDKERSVCLSLVLMNEACYTNEQCMGDSKCIDGFCSCGADSISLYNPSAKIFYCHPKRRLNEACNHDAQCPDNAFCSTKKHGCLCQNGYGASIVNIGTGAERTECLPKICRSSSDCESEYHVCDENRCKCLATHFDPHTALCYKFGSTGGQLDSNSTTNSTTANSTSQEDNIIVTLLKDLTNNGDRMWPIILLLILLTILILALMICLVRKYCLGLCWTAYKKEYEPNNKNPTNGNNFSKNSINNKSFRQKKTDAYDEDEDENLAGRDSGNKKVDRSNLVVDGAVKNSSRSPFKNGTTNGKSTSGDNHYVKVDLSNPSDDEKSKQNTYGGTRYQPFHQVLGKPLPSSTSTPV